jgi:hypothetical protein
VKKTLLILAGGGMGVLALACLLGGRPDLVVTPLGVAFTFGSFVALRAAFKAPAPQGPPAPPGRWGEGWDRR